MCQAHQPPFVADLRQAPQQETAAAARALDLPEHRRHRLLARPVPTAVTALKSTRCSQAAAVRREEYTP
jgi:hypothetical protein